MADQQEQKTRRETCGGETVQMDISKIFGDTDQDFGRLLDSPGHHDFPEYTTGQDSTRPELTQKPPDKYKFRKSIGRGGMKMVLQVRDTDTARDVAMAVLPDAAIRPRKDLRKFIEEARITAALEHPNIVPVHEIGMDAAGAPYFTMKLLRGETLASVLERLNRQDPEALERYRLFHLLHIFIKICNGISFAHSKGVLHMDLKPSNIQIGEFGEVLVLDWGLAKVMTRKNDPALSFCPFGDPEPFFDGSTVTLDGVTKGTPGYMAPEQAAGQNSKLDEKSDIYSLGAILYAILTWKNPLDPENLQNMLQRTVYGNIVPPRERAPERDIPSALEAVVQKAMRVNPAERYNSVEELREDVNAYIGGFATDAEQATVIKKSFLFAKRNLLTFIPFSIIVFLLIAALIYATQENALKKAPWIPVYQQQFAPATPQQNLPNVQSSDVSGYLLVPQLTDQGILLQNGTMAVLPLPSSNELRIDLSFVCHNPDQPLSVFLKNPYGAGYLLELWADQHFFHRLSRVEPNGQIRLLHAVPESPSGNPEKQRRHLCWIINQDTHQISLQSGQVQKEIFNWEDFSAGFTSPLNLLEFRPGSNPNEVLLTA